MAPNKVSFDARAYGHVDTLIQKYGSPWKPVIAIAPRCITDTEHSYAQTEKEPWPSPGEEKNFTTCILGTTFLIEIEHKSQVPLLD